MAVTDITAIEIKLAATEKDFQGICGGCDAPIISQAGGVKALGYTLNTSTELTFYQDARIILIISSVPRAQ